MKAIGAILVLGLAASPAVSQTRVDEKRKAAKDATVEIENLVGSIKIVAWSNPEVQVTGSLGPDIESLDFSGGPERLQISPEPSSDWSGSHGWGGSHKSRATSARSDLEVHVPEGSRVRVDGYASSVQAEGLNGRLEVETVDGSITVSGGKAELELESVNGAVSVDSAAQRVEAQSVNGKVLLKIAGGEIEASSVSGGVELSGGSFTRISVESVSGSVRFAGALESRGSLRLQTVSGGARVELPASQGADVSVSTFSGRIDADFGAPSPVKTSRYAPGKELRFTIGAGGARIEIETLSGSVDIRKAGQ